MSATDSDDFGRCKWCGNLTDSAGCLNITCAAQSARRDSQVSGIEETVARVRDALDGVPDSTTLYARGMKLTGWRHEVTAGEVRTLLAAVDTRTRENAAFVSAVREAIGFCEGDESPEELVSFVQSMSERIPELTRERDALREAVETKDRAHGMAVDREFAAIARADRYRAALETVASIHERHNDCSQVERIQQAYDMRCVARRALTEDA